MRRRGAAHVEHVGGVLQNLGGRKYMGARRAESAARQAQQREQERGRQPEYEPMRYRGIHLRHPIAARRPRPLGLRRKRRLSSLIRIAVAAMERPAIAIMDALHGPGSGLDIARAGGPHGNPPHVHPHLRACGGGPPPGAVPPAAAPPPPLALWGPCLGTDADPPP